MTGTLRGVSNKHCLLSFFSFVLTLQFFCVYRMVLPVHHQLKGLWINTLVENLMSSILKVDSYEEKAVYS